MSQERLVFPIVIQGYGEIKGMNDWQVFVKHYRLMCEAHAERGKYIESLETYVKLLKDGNCPICGHSIHRDICDWVTTYGDACGCLMKPDAIERLKPEHYKMVGEEVAR